MTKEQINQMQKLRRAGCTYQRIADEYGVSRQYVWQILHPLEEKNGRRGRRVEWAYPRVVEWMQEHNMTARDMAQAMGVTPVTLATAMKGRGASEKTIGKLLTLTGMTRKELFSTSEGGGEHA